MPGTVTPQLTFMALVTLILLVTIQGATVYMLVASSITASEYLAVWSPILTLALGYWFGKQQGAV
jgi:hypothetical protein